MSADTHNSENQSETAIDAQNKVKQDFKARARKHIEALKKETEEGTFQGDVQSEIKRRVQAEIDAEKHKQDQQSQTTSSPEVDLSDIFFKMVKKRDEIFGINKIKQIKPLEPISLEVTKDHKIKILFDKEETVFTFDDLDNLNEESKKVTKRVLDDFVTAFKQKYPANDIYFELTAYDKKDLDKALRYLHSMGITVEAIKLVTDSNNITHDTPEAVQAYYKSIGIDISPQKSNDVQLTSAPKPRNSPRP